MYPILFKINNVSVYSHGVFMVLGMIFGAGIIYYLAKRRRLKTDFLFDNIIITILFGIIGARLTYFFLYQEQFSNIREVLYIWQGGLVSYGGFVAGGLTLYLLLKSQGESILGWFDLFSVAFPAGLFWGRVGDILAGDNDAALILGSAGKYIPVPLLEAILCLIIFVVLFMLHYKQRIRTAGLYFLLMLLLYSGGRFMIDFHRTENQFLLGLSIGQLFSLLLFLIALIFYTKIFLKNKERSIL